MRTKTEDKGIQVMAHEVVLPHGEVLGTFPSASAAQREADYIQRTFLIPTIIRPTR